MAISERDSVYQFLKDYRNRLLNGCDKKKKKGEGKKLIITVRNVRPS